MGNLRNYYFQRKSKNL